MTITIFKQESYKTIYIYKTTYILQFNYIHLQSSKIAFLLGNYILKIKSKQI